MKKLNFSLSIDFFYLSTHGFKKYFHRLSSMARPAVSKLFGRDPHLSLVNTPQTTTCCDDVSLQHEHRTNNYETHVIK